ncbi:hypothetical protein ACLB2K_067240 [Fragaria x ananassa]
MAISSRRSENEREVMSLSSRSTSSPNWWVGGGRGERGRAAWWSPIVQQRPDDGIGAAGRSGITPPPFAAKSQPKEIAIGLEQSGQRFLWSVRQSPPTGALAMPGEYTNHEEFLPRDFSKMTKGIGMLCGWAPQAREQQINAFQMARDLGLGLVYKKGGGFVTADEIERALRRLMEEGDGDIRKRVQ